MLDPYPFLLFVHVDSVEEIARVTYCNVDTERVADRFLSQNPIGLARVGAATVEKHGANYGHQYAADWSSV